MQQQSTAANGLKATFTGIKSQTSKNGLHRHYFNYDMVTHSGGSGALLNTGSVVQWTNEAGEHVHEFTPAGTVSLAGNSETRPDNYTCRIWKRVA